MNQMLYLCIMQDIQTGIYMIRNKKDNKFYIGRTLNFRKRIISHRTELNNQIHHSFRLQRAWNKHKEENFEFVLIEECSKEIYRDREQFWIDLLKPDYNLAQNSRGGRFGPQKQSTIEKIRESKRKMDIYQFDLENNFIAKFRSVMDAARSIGKTSCAHICSVCKGKRPTAYGFKWSYTEKINNIKKE